MQRARRKKLSYEQIHRLDTLGFVWDKQAKIWEEGFKELCSYEKKNGNCLVSRLYKTNGKFALGTWVGQQRKSKHRLSKENIQRLDDLGFIWDQLQYQWEKGFDALYIYSQENEDCDVPARYETIDGYALGQWVGVQSKNAKRGTLSVERTERLNKLGFVWDVNEAKWERAFALLKVYKDIKGDCLIERREKYNDFGLGSWVSVQRRSRENKTLSSGKIKRLDELDFNW